MIVTVVGTTIGKWKNKELKKLDLIQTDEQGEITNLDIEIFEKDEFTVTYATFFNLSMFERHWLRDLKEFFTFIDWYVYEYRSDHDENKKEWYNESQVLLNNLIYNKKIK